MMKSPHAKTRSWTERGRKFWDQRQRRAVPGGLTGYLLDESPPAIGRHRFEGEWAEVKGWLKRHEVAGGACLDLGCGTGVWLKALAPYFKTLEGWDYAPAMVRASRKTLAAAGVKAKLVCGDITKRKGSACFDLIFVGGVLTYTPEEVLGPLLKSLRRLLRPGGLLIVRESTLRCGLWMREGVDLRPGLMASPLQKAGQDYVAIYRARGDYVAALKAAGFKLRAVRQNVHYKLSDLTEDWLRRLKVGPGRAEPMAKGIFWLRFVLLYPEYYLRRWKLRNHWFLAGT